MRLGLGLCQSPLRHTAGLDFGGKGFWFDPEPARLFQNAAGTVPATIGQPVALLRDRSGSSADAYQDVNADYRPLMGGQTAQGGWYLSFDGVDDWFTLDMASGIRTSSMTMVAAIKTDDNNFVFMGGTGETDSARFMHAQEASTSGVDSKAGTPSYLVNRVATAAQRDALESAISINDWVIVEVRQLDVTDAQWASAQLSGYRNDGATASKFSGDIGQIMLFDDAEVTTTERDQIVTNMAALYGVTL